MSDRNDRTISQAAQSADNVSNPFRMGNSVATTGGALVSVEQQRAIAEVQARMIIARANPRDPIRCMDLILQDCTRPTLAESALYQYARGGTSISGPSIRLAESIARRWGNIASGIKEISRDDGYSECVAYAWCLESGYYDERQFQIRHWRDTKGGGYRLTDERDIYEMIASFGQRRKRAVLLTVIPGDVVEAAVEQCERTMHTTADTSPEALRKVADAFKAAFGVTQEQIEKRCQCRLEAIRAAQVVQLRKIYASLKDGMSAPADWFEGGASSAAAVVAAADAKAKPAATKDAPIAGDPPAQAATGDRRDARSDVKDAAPSPGKDQPAPTQQVQQQRQADPEPETGAWFPTDDIGEPVEIPGGAEAFTSAMEFAGWLCTAMDLTTRPDALYENNLDHVEELKLRWPDLFAEVDARYRTADMRVTKAQADALAAQQAAANQPASGPENGAGDDAAGGGIPALKVPTTQAGKPSWPQYATLAQKDLGALSTQMAITEWVNRNFPTYQGKAIAPAIEKHIRERRSAIDADKRVVPQTVDAPATAEQQQPAADVDPDVKRCDGYLAEIAAFKTLDEARTFANRTDVTTIRRRFAEERPDLAKLIKDAGEAKWVALGGGAP